MALREYTRCVPRRHCLSSLIVIQAFLPMKKSIKSATIKENARDLDLGIFIKRSGKALAQPASYCY